MSWLIQRDVDQGRSELNFSEWDRPQKEADEAAEALAEGEMPPWFYTPLHSESELNAMERDALVKGLAATLGSPEPHEHRKSQKR